MLWKILPQTVFHAAGAGQRKPELAEEGAELQRTVLFISQRERLYTLTGFLPPPGPGPLCQAGSSVPSAGPWGRAREGVTPQALTGGNEL